jgi:hypothetical protein
MDDKSEYEHDDDDAEKYTFDDHCSIVAYKLPTPSCAGGAGPP